jgi:uncharacterized protein (UPF0210 family)
MIDRENLDIRTITMGISLINCVCDDMQTLSERIYDRICACAKDLVRVGREIEEQYGIPIVNKRVSVTPIALVAGGTGAKDYVPVARAMDRAAKTLGVDFIGGFSALVHKGATQSDETLLRSIPEALCVTDFVCSSVNIGTTRAGINMDAVRQMGEIIKAAAELTADRDGMARPSWCGFATPWRTTPSWPERFTARRAGLRDQRGVSGPGVVNARLRA